MTTFAIYFFTSAGNTPYDYFTRLANAFLHGKYYLTENPPWLSELIPIAKNRFVIVYPPAAAILLIPFVAVFGVNFPQNIFANFIGAAIVITSAILSFEITKSWIKTFWLVLLVGFGNILWFMSATGSVWLLGQTVAVLFILLAILALEKKLNPIIIGVFFGIAFLSRIELIVVLPFFFFMIEKNKLFKLFVGLIPFIVFYLFYNYLRFGNIFETGYALIPGVLKEPWYAQGIINPSYISRNLKVLFESMPIFKSSFPFVIPSWGGLAIWITTPAFIYSFFAPLAEKSVKLAWVSVLAILLLISMHGETGYAQFGYRFAVDFYPFLFFLVAKAIKNKNLVIHYWILLFVCIIVNLWGVVLINKLGIVAP